MADLQYTVNAQQCAVKSLYNRGQVGQMIVLANVSFEGSRSPLARYEIPSVFTILEVLDEGRNGWNAAYRLRDAAGEEIVIGRPEEGTSCNSDASYFYDAQEYLRYARAERASKEAGLMSRLRHLESQRDLLKDILAPKGVHVITEDEMKGLQLRRKGNQA